MQLLNNSFCKQIYKHVSHISYFKQNYQMCFHCFDFQKLFNKTRHQMCFQIHKKLITFIFKTIIEKATVNAP